MYKLFLLMATGQLAYVGMMKMGEKEEVIINMKDLMSRTDLKDNDTFRVVERS